MGHTRWIAVAAATLLAAGCGGTRSAKPAAEHEKELPVREVAAELKTPLADAIAAAIARSPGEAIEAVLEGEVGKGAREVFVEVMVLDAHGGAIEVKVDPADGKILSADPEDEADEIAELAAVAKQLPSGHLSLGELVRRAASATEGQIVAASFEVTKAHGAVGVVQFLVGETLRQVTLDPKTAAVLEKKTLHEDEDEDEDDEGDEKGEGPEHR